MLQIEKQDASEKIEDQLKPKKQQAPAANLRSGRRLLSRRLLLETVHPANRLRPCALSFAYNRLYKTPDRRLEVSKNERPGGLPKHRFLASNSVLPPP
jgi:hypothetical protein